MHRSLVLAALLPLLSLATAGCEDGPNQTYSPLPGNAWQNTAVDASVAPGTHDFDASYPTTGKLTLCSADFKRERWAWMLTQPIVPPRYYAGIDMAGGDLWAGLTIDKAEIPPATPTTDGGGLCQSVAQGAQGSCPSGFGNCDGNYWGNNQEVSVSWNVATHVLDQMVLSLGYTGAVQTEKYPNHNGAIHDYSITIGDVMRRDGQPFLLPWNGDPAVLAADITDIFNAMMASYATAAGIAWNTQPCTDDSACSTSNEVCQCQHDAPITCKTNSDCTATPKTPTCDMTLLECVDSMGNPAESFCMSGSAGARCGDADCGSDGYCLVYPGGWIFGVRPLVFYVSGVAGVPQPALSTPTSFYNFWSKFEPYSNLPQRIELGATGPISSGTPLGAKDPSTMCTQGIGQTFGDLTKNCVEVAGDISNPKGVDAVNFSKVTHGLQHDQEHWTADVLGVNQNFTSLKVANNPSLVVLDTDTPQSGDVAQDWTFDTRARGNLWNDYNMASGAAELRGSSLVYIEWARLMLADVARQLGLPKPKTLGDPTCTGFASDGSPNYASTTGCSGIEGLIIPGAGGAGTDFSMDPLRPDLNPASNWDSIVGWYPSMLKPGSATGAICIDPLTQTNCDWEELPAALASIWEVVLNHAVTVLGKGKAGNLPPEMQDVRYYYKWFGVAVVKYLKAYGGYDPAMRDNFPDGTPGHGLGPSDVMAQAYDAESLFFDYSTSPGVGGAQTFDKFEYVDRDYVGKGSGGALNWIPWDFAYGTDILGGNQRYDDFYRRMDREEIAMYASMLVNKSDTPGLENNVSPTNLFGSPLIGGIWSSYLCAIGQYSDPTVMGGNECGGMNPPLDPTNPSGLPACSGTGTCAAGSVCVQAKSYEAGMVGPWCAKACDYTKFPTSGCGPTQACVLAGAAAGCVDMKMDKNGPNPCTDPVTGAGVACKAPSVVVPHPILFYYPGAWTRTPFGAGHSPITLNPSDEQPAIGVAKISIPNFLNGPYTDSPLLANSAGKCPMGYTASGIWCNAALNKGACGAPPAPQTCPSFTPLVPWLAVGGGESSTGNPVGFSIPLDGNRTQFLTTGQLDFTGVLETYVVDYVRYQDPSQPSCVGTGMCNKGFTCDAKSALCITMDNTIRIEAIEGEDFLGQVFLCQDPATGDILHLGMYDSALGVQAWLAAHPGFATYGVATSAQVACNILIKRSPSDNAIDELTSLSAGVNINFSGGQAQGRVTDIVLFDTNLIQSF